MKCVCGQRIFGPARYCAKCVLCIARAQRLLSAADTSNNRILAVFDCMADMITSSYRLMRYNAKLYRTVLTKLDEFEETEKIRTTCQLMRKIIRIRQQLCGDGCCPQRILQRRLYTMVQKLRARRKLFTKSI